MTHPPRPDKLAKCGCAFDTLRSKPGAENPKEMQWFCWRHNETDTMEDPTDLSTRQAHCTYCGKAEKSADHKGLAFFEYRKDQDTDRYYCGCYGWD